MMEGFIKSVEGTGQKLRELIALNCTCERLYVTRESFEFLLLDKDPG